MYTLSRLVGGFINDITYKFRPVLTLLFQVQIYIWYKDRPTVQHPLPSIHETFTQCWLNVRPASKTVGQQLPSIGWMFVFTGFLHVSTRIFTINPYINKSTCDFGQERRGHGAMARAPDSHQSCMRPGFEPRCSRVWGFQRSSIVSPFSIWLGDHINGSLVE